ncbi:MAG TPA: DUF3500 domain-containing protein [Luteolibacter sp.]|nr:DUF3500 domain-containing protein [Luteolibacter sp.]
MIHLSCCAASIAHEGHVPSLEMAAAARTWLDSLDAAQRKGAIFEVADEERQNWHFVPRARKGLSLKDMAEVQQKHAKALVAAGLSQRGVLAADAIIALEDVLRKMEGSPRRDSGLYYFTVFGKPDAKETWGWRLEGHHLSINFLITKKGDISATPMFFGANPAEVRIEHEMKGRRTLAAEEDLGRELMKSFDDEQRRTALIAAEAPADIVTGADREAKLAAPTGLPYTRMNADQQKRLRELVDFYAGRLREEIAEREVRRIADRGWDHLHFAWAGGLEPGDGHYYRIHSPDFVIEYDNVQNGANHIHTAWRDFKGDFGRDLLREHHEEAHGGGIPH